MPHYKLSHFLPKLTKKALRKHGFSVPNLILEWSQIVGPNLATMCNPISIYFGKQHFQRGTLTIKSYSTVAITLQHMEPIVIERINRYYGYNAIGRLKLIQTQIPFQKKRPHHSHLPQLSNQEEQTIREKFAHVSHFALKAQLIKLAFRAAALEKQEITKQETSTTHNK